MGRATSRRGERIDAQLGRFQSDGTIEVVASGRRISVEGGIPTEMARLAIEGHGKHWRGEVISLIEPSAERTTPRCPVVDICGGCEWQHLDQAGQLKHKAAITRRLLSAQRLPTRIDEIVPMPDPWHYRVRAQIALGSQAGFRRKRAKQIVRLDGCPVVHPLIDRLLEQLNRLIRLREIPDWRGKLLVEAQVVGPERERGLQLLLDGVDGLRLDQPDELIGTAAALAAQRGIVSVAYRRSDGEIIPLEGSAFCDIEVGGRCYQLPAGAFFQSNLALLPRFIDKVIDLTELSGIERIADIYGGIGLFGLALAERAAQVTIVEIEPKAIEAASRTISERDLSNVEVIAAPAEDVVADLPELDLVVVDPPRTGLDRRVTDALIDHRPETIISVSCNPATFARDAAAFVRAGYTIDYLSLWDFYPQTVHVEVLAKLTR